MQFACVKVKIEADTAGKFISGVCTGLHEVVFALIAGNHLITSLHWKKKKKNLISLEITRSDIFQIFKINVYF